MVSYEFSYDATPELARQAAGRFIWRRAGIWLVFLVIALLAGLFMLLSGDRSWFTIVLVTVATVKGWAWVRIYLKAGMNMKGIADPKVTVRVDDDTFEMKYAQAETKVEWNAPMRIWRFELLWLISFLDTKHHTYIPTNILSDEVRRFIEAKVVENGGIVT